MDNKLFLLVKNTKDILAANDWVLTNKSGKILKLSTANDSIQDLIREYDNKLEVVLIIPDKYASFHIVDLPIKERKKQAQALPFILEEQIISEIEDMHFAIGPRIASDKYITAVIEKNILKDLIEGVRNEIGGQPRYIITEAMCLYSPDEDLLKYKIYFNKEEDTVLFCNNHIAIADLSNADMILTTIRNERNLTVDIFKYKLDNITDLFANNIKNVTIGSEQSIDNWLSFLVTTWFNNSRLLSFRQKFNLLTGYLKQSDSLISFNSHWQKIFGITAAVMIFFVGYKYLDTLLFKEHYNKLNQSIRTELSDIKINATDLKIADKMITKNIEDISARINKSEQKNIFYSILARFSQNYLQETELKSLKFDDNAMSINFIIKKDNINFLDRIKQKLSDDGLVVKEQVINDGKEVEINWQLNLT